MASEGGSASSTVFKFIVLPKNIGKVIMLQLVTGIDVVYSNGVNWE